MSSPASKDYNGANFNRSPYQLSSVFCAYCSLCNSYHAFSRSKLTMRN